MNDDQIKQLLKLLLDYSVNKGNSDSWNAARNMLNGNTPVDERKISDIADQIVTDIQAELNTRQEQLKKAQETVDYCKNKIDFFSKGLTLIHDSLYNYDK